RGCTVEIWHRKPEWKLNALAPRQDASSARDPPLENPAVNGPWICNKGRDLARIFERPRALQALTKGRPVDLPAAIEAAGKLIREARQAVALVSSWGSNEELAAFLEIHGGRFEAFVKEDCLPEPGECLEDDVLIRPDKNPNTAAARALFAHSDDV